MQRLVVVLLAALVSMFAVQPYSNAEEKKVVLPVLPPIPPAFAGVPFKSTLWIETLTVGGSPALTSHGKFELTVNGTITGVTVTVKTWDGTNWQVVPGTRAAALVTPQTNPKHFKYSAPNFMGLATDTKYKMHVHINFTITGQPADSVNYHTDEIKLKAP